MDDRRLTDWMEGYVRAWNSNDPADIQALFTEDAVYLTEPYAEPWQGRNAIVRGWLEIKDEPGQTTFRWEPLAVEGDLHLVQGRTEYRIDPPRSYRNLWAIRLDGDGRCFEFTEWWMKEPLPE
ncbi:nuclear transport factor 2 family protein [Georgenia yuyongxinii]|uniref:Nuclear transport factor 2 family protein n=1 Tax=Georgenia yuyongxinii TaxID=2589797 RepID=A0A552WL66_9MICO|nr:nuclear transport factor 2 family protein [Georgenia yuyongxinii]TRW43213.1 nuclear transport factor 2 family protein [Georgenia yuyongxinii]